MAEPGPLGYICPICKTPNPASVKYCVKCGHWLFDSTPGYEAKPLTKREYKSYFGSNPEAAATAATGTAGNKAVLIGWVILLAIFSRFIGDKARDQPTCSPTGGCQHY